MILSKKKIYIKNIVEYIIAFCFILNLRSMYNYIDGKGHLFSLLIFSINTLSIIFYCYILNKEKGGIPKKIYYLIFLLLYLGVFIIFNKTNMREYILYLISFIMIILLYILNNFDKKIPIILYRYSTIVYYIAMISCVIWLFGSILHLISPSGTISTIWTWTGEPKEINTFWLIQFEPQVLPRSFGFFEKFSNLVRNTSIFTEAPMASFNFSVALLIEVFLKKKINFNKFIVFCIAIATTFATTGYVVIAGIFVYMYLTKQFNSKILKLIRLFFIPIALIVGGYTIITLISEKLSVGSGMIRVDDFVAGYKTWKNNLIFGAGFENTKIFENYMSSFRSYNKGYSNSVMQILGQGGIWLFLPYAASFANSIFNSVKKIDINRLFFTMLFLFLFTVTIVSYQYLCIYCLAVIFDGKIFEIRKEVDSNE